MPPSASVMRLRHFSSFPSLPAVQAAGSVRRTIGENSGGKALDAATAVASGTSMLVDSPIM